MCVLFQRSPKQPRVVAPWTPIVALLLFHALATSSPATAARLAFDGHLAEPTRSHVTASGCCPTFVDRGGGGGGGGGATGLFEDAVTRASRGSPTWKRSFSTTQQTPFLSGASQDVALTVIAKQRGRFVMLPLSARPLTRHVSDKPCPAALECL
ncbi:unnamed protein product [Lampetra fluviatilis]